MKNHSRVGIGEEKKNFDAGKGVLMTFYTEHEDLENANALCQYWDMTGGVGGKYLSNCLIWNLGNSHDLFRRTS